ncbi:protein kinase [Acidicapsa dinghuensis]|uniref:Protein kinase n=1 Tax=Acidicapsa dinghuensis TaxID=2218256 RepID=A0ABW1EMS4_9BACT|nr:serine/threonine-protein kinase [Acidicapsa dinghuensis]
MDRTLNQFTSRQFISNEPVTPCSNLFAISNGRWDNDGVSQGQDARFSSLESNRGPHIGTSAGMKFCPICATSYPASHRTCPTHGAVLIETTELAPGTMIRDCYRIERTIGKGGMGIVYLAEHTLLGEPRALKFLSGSLASNPTFVQRFLQEARAASKLRHPNIAQTLELGQAEDGSFYISMEFVDGPSLRALLDQSPKGLPPARAFNIVRGVAEALGAAHAKRMVHRDVKPENVLLAWTPESETAKVVDFGIVALSDSVGRLTQTGRPLMTAQYAAPEQWRGVIPPSELDGRTDLYALGCMFFETLTGRLPFNAETYEGWFEQHVHTVPSALSQVNPDLACYAGLDALMFRLLAKEREQRPANVHEFVFELNRITGFAPAGTGAISGFPQGLPSGYSSGSQGGFSSGPVSGPGGGFDSGSRARTILDVGLPGVASGQVYSGAASSGPASSGPPPFVPPYGQQNYQQAPQLMGNPGAPGFAQGNGAVAGYTTPSAGSGPIKPGGLSKGMRVFLGVAGALVIVVGIVFAIVEQKKKNESLSSETSSASSADSTSSSTGTATSQPQISKPDASKQFPSSFPSQPQTANPVQSETGDASATAKRAIALYDNKQYTEAEPLFEQACNGGHADSCDYLGWMYEYQLGVQQDYSRAITLFEKGCGMGSMAACNNEGVMYEDHTGVPQDYQRALSLYTKACDGGLAIGCDSLGSMYQSHEGVAQDNSRAVYYYSKACDGSNAAGCKDLGWMYQYHLGVDQDYPRAVQLYGKACDGGNMQGCNNLGYMYQHAYGVQQDYQKAISLYTRACAADEASSCNSLGVMYEEHQGVTENDSLAVSYYEKACNLNNPNGCSDLGNMYRQGKGIQKDPVKAREFLSKGCNLGSQWGCDSLKDMK